MHVGRSYKFVDLSEAYGDGTMRLTVEQNVLFKWVKKESLAAVLRAHCRGGLGAADANTLGDVVSCPGAESCRLAVTQSRGLGRALTNTEHAPGAGPIVPAAKAPSRSAAARTVAASITSRRSDSRAACARWAARRSRSIS